MSAEKRFVGVYMTDDGPITIREDMPREQMWFVLQKVMEMLESERRSHRDTLQRELRGARERL